MKIGNLNQHCGNCNLVSYCGNPYGYCLCTDQRFEDMEESEYAKLADTAQTKPYPLCGSCTEDCEGIGCEHEDLARDYRMEQIADYVERKAQEGKTK